MSSRNSLLWVGIIVIALLPSASSWAGENLLNDPNFEDGGSAWFIRHYHAVHEYDDPNDGREWIDPDPNGYVGACLAMENYNTQVSYQGARQTLGTLQEGLYEFSAKFKTSSTHYAYINLYNVSLNEYNSIKVQGTGTWETIKMYLRIPPEQTNDEFRIFLYAHDPLDDYSPIRYDNVIFRKIEEDPSSCYSDIEENDEWAPHVRLFTDGYPLTSYDPNTTVSYEDDPNDTENIFLVLQGDPNTQIEYRTSVPVKPSTKYKISGWFSYKEREGYNYLDSSQVVTYPAIYTEQGGSRLENMKGIWCGKYDLKVTERCIQGTDPNILETKYVSVLPDDAGDSMYISDYNRNWFYEEKCVETSSYASSLDLKFEFKGFKGKFLVDQLTIEEIDSHIENKYFTMPVDFEFQGMKIESVNTAIPSVETNAAIFTFTDSSIVMTKKDPNEVVGTIYFSENFLSNLTCNTDTPGVVILEDPNVIKISIGADSTLLVRLDKDENISIESELDAKYHNFEVGTLFVSDFEKGLLFSPVLPSINVMWLGDYDEYDSVYRDRTFPDKGLAVQGLKKWTTEPDFDDPVWGVEYQFNQGDGFIASVFPPKQFDYTEYAMERMNVSDLSINEYPQVDYRYYIQNFKERNNIMMLWMGRYNQSDNDDTPTIYYKKTDGEIVGPQDDWDEEEPFIHNDVAGPFEIAEPNALLNLVSQAHEQGIKVIVYLSPRYHFTSDTDVLVDNVEYLLRNFNLDGIYFDGYYGQGKVLKTLELVRKTRSLLTHLEQDINKEYPFHYTQHNSWISTILFGTDHIRVPFFDAYADQIWLGEGCKKDWSGNPDTWVKSDCEPDPNVWGLLYCNRNLSNTPSTLLAELRPINASLNHEQNRNLSLEPNEQCDLQLEYSGAFKINWTNLLYESYKSYMGDSYYDPIYFDARGWWDTFDQVCLDYTINDQRDIGETIYSAFTDCAPVTFDSILLKNTDTSYTCDTDDSVAQWVIDDEPFYRIHFTFDNDIISNDADRKMSPDRLIGLSYNMPVLGTVDSRKACYFDGDTKVFGLHDESVFKCDDSGKIKQFSSFAMIKPDTYQNEQTLFSINSDNDYAYGIKDGKFIFKCIDTCSTVVIDPNGDSGNCLAMQHNDSPFQYVKQGVDIPAAGTYVLSVKYKTTSSHKGYINLYNSTTAPYSHTNLLDGTGSWESIPVEVEIPAEQVDDDWKVVLYGHYPTTDNSVVYYDEIQLVKSGESNNLVENPGFENGFEDWTSASTTPLKLIEGSANICNSQWHSVGIVYQDPNISLYVDGVKENSDTIDFAIDSNSMLGTYTLGALSKSSTTTYYSGYMDDFFVTDRALTSTQVTAYHNNLLKTLDLESTPDTIPIDCVIVDGYQYYSVVTGGVWNKNTGQYYGTINDAIDDAENGDELIAYPGTYYENVDFDGKAIIVRSFDPNDSDIVAATIIDADSIGTVVTFDDNEGTDSVLSGFTITGGLAPGSGDDCDGGGIICDGASPTITKCVIENNDADDDGGGIYCYDYSNPEISFCTIANNHADDKGGGVYCKSNSNAMITHCTFDTNTANSGGGLNSYGYSEPVISNCIFIHNSANVDSSSVGAGLSFHNNSGGTINNCFIIDNEATDKGGGIYCRDSSNPTFTNCVIVDNDATEGAGVTVWKDSGPSFINCILSSNSATTYGGGFCFDSNCDATITNCILWNNSAGTNGDEVRIKDSASDPTFSYCDIEGGINGDGFYGYSAVDGGGNIDADPNFVDSSDPDGDDDEYYTSDDGFMLTSGSDCIDTADNSEAPSHDIRGEARDEYADIGAYEYFAD